MGHRHLKFHVARLSSFPYICPLWSPILVASITIHLVSQTRNPGTVFNVSLVLQIQSPTSVKSTFLAFLNLICSLYPTINFLVVTTTSPHVGHPHFSLCLPVIPSHPVSTLKSGKTRLWKVSWSASWSHSFALYLSILSTSEITNPWPTHCHSSLPCLWCTTLMDCYIFFL